MSLSVSVIGLEQAIHASAAQLGRFGASYPIYLRPPTGFEIVTAADILAAENLRYYSERAIKLWTQHPEEEDIRAAASRFMRRYCGSVAMAALLPLAHGVSVDLSIDRLSFLIRTDMPMGVVIDLDESRTYTALERPTDWPIDGTQLRTLQELRAKTVATLFLHNLTPAFEAILRFVHVNPKLLWSTAAEQVDLLYENAQDGLSDEEFASFASDRSMLLFDASLPGVEGPVDNPLCGLLEWEDAEDPQFPRPLQVRRICCVCYVIPGRNAYCRTCGLISKQERLELWRSWKASIVPKGA